MIRTQPHYYGVQRSNAPYAVRASEPVKAPQPAPVLVAVDGLELIDLNQPTPQMNPDTRRVHQLQAQQAALDAERRTLAAAAQRVAVLMATAAALNSRNATLKAAVEDAASAQLLLQRRYDILHACYERLSFWTAVYVMAAIVAAATHYGMAP